MASAVGKALGSGEHVVVIGMMMLLLVISGMAAALWDVGVLAVPEGSKEH